MEAVMPKQSHARALTPEIVACALTFTKREVRLLLGVQDAYIEKCVKDGVLKARWINSRNLWIEGDSLRQHIASLPSSKADAPAAGKAKTGRAA
jgi:hypothetical protein